MKFDTAFQDEVGRIRRMHHGSRLVGGWVRLELGDDLKVAFLDEHMRQTALNLLGRRAGLRSSVDQRKLGDFHAAPGCDGAGAIGTTAIFEDRYVAALAQHDADWVLTAL